RVTVRVGGVATDDDREQLPRFEQQVAVADDLGRAVAHVVVHNVAGAEGNDGAVAIGLRVERDRVAAGGRRDLEPDGAHLVQSAVRNGSRVVRLHDNAAAYFHGAAGLL